MQRWLSEQEMAAWDGFVDRHPNGWLCHLSGWKRALEKSFPHIRGHIAALVNEHTGAVEAGLPAYHVASRLTGNRVVCAPFATLFDPLVSSPDQLGVLLPAVVDLYKRTGSRRIEFRTLHAPALFNSPDFAAASSYRLHELELGSSPETLMRAFSRSNIRQSIAKAQKAPLRAYTATTLEELGFFYELYGASRRHLGLPALPLQFFQALWHEFSAAGHARFVIAEYANKPVAALMALQFKERFSVDYLGWDRDFKRVSPSPFILWEAIKLAYAAGCTIFDFGRTPVDHASLLKFKRRWGAQEKDLIDYYYPAQWIGRHKVKKESTIAYRLVRHAAQCAPAPLYGFLSGFCYRHLG